MTTRLLRRHAPVVASVVGADNHRGWLPTGAATPLPTEPLSALLDVRLLSQGEAFVLAWEAHDPVLWSQPSGRAEKTFLSLAEASAAAETLFAIGDKDWTIEVDNRNLLSNDVTTVVDSVLAAHEIEDPAEHGWGTIVDPPRLADFRLDSGLLTRLWLVLTDPAGYSVFYDGDTGGFGLATSGKDGELIHVGDYGSLWATLVGM